jgi:heme-degrading monooxygenase HmoA
MLARVNFFEGSTEGAGQATREIVWPGIRELEGYRGYIVLLSPDGDRAVGITLWKSEQAEEASRHVAETIRPRLEAATGGKVVKVERYEVGVFDVAGEET